LLANQDDAGVSWSVTEDGLGCSPVQRASRAVPRRGGEDAEAAGRGHEWRCRPGFRRGGDRGFRSGSGTRTVGG
jgi:hypothetical protein